jgi:hypothetical protein
MKSKVIQITAATDHDDDPVLFALCEDGSLWVKSIVGGIWEEIETP